MKPLALSILKQFCSKDKQRPALLQPWLDGLNTIATDGHVCVRLDYMHPKVTLEQPKLNVSPFFQDLPRRSDDFSPMPSVFHGVPRNDPMAPKEVVSFIGGRWIREKVARNMALLPGIMIADKQGSSMDHLFFKFDGGCGVVCPMRPPVVDPFANRI